MEWLGEEMKAFVLVVFGVGAGVMDITFGVVEVIVIVRLSRAEGGEEGVEAGGTDWSGREAGMKAGVIGVIDGKIGGGEGGNPVI